MDNTPILTIALYLCCQLDSQDLLQGRKRADHGVDRMSDLDLALCMRGKANLCTRKVQMIQDVFAPINNTECTTGLRRCNASLGEIMAVQISSVNEGDADILDPWKSIIRSHRRSGSKSRTRSTFCLSCVTLVVERELTIRAELWSDLPRLLGLQAAVENMEIAN